MPPSVSVIIAAYNAAEYLGECLESVLAQSGVTFEVIVVDDGSTDGTADVAHSYPVQYVHQANSGTCSVPRNNGARAARGEFLTFFDADDVMCPERLARQETHLRDQANCQLTVCDYRNFTCEAEEARSHFETCVDLQRLAGVVVGGGAVTVPSRTARRVLCDENFASACGTMVRRTWFNEVGGFDSSLRASEDFDLVYRAALAGDVGVHGFVGFRRRLHDLNMSRDSPRILLFKALSREKLAALEGSRELRRRLASKSAAYRVSVARELWPRDRRGAVESLWRAVALRGYPATDVWRAIGAMLSGGLRSGQEEAPDF